jgi:hypothetical protein
MAFMSLFYASKLTYLQKIKEQLVKNVSEKVAVYLESDTKYINELFLYKNVGIPKVK